MRSRITSLSLMAFMSKAHFPGFGPHGEQLDRGHEMAVERGIKARPDGYLGTVMYEHGLATLALSELWGMARDPEDDDAIQKALEKARRCDLALAEPWWRDGATSHRQTAAKTPRAPRPCSMPWRPHARPGSPCPTRRSPRW